MGDKLDRSMVNMLKQAGVLDADEQIVVGGDGLKQIAVILPWLKKEILSGEIVADSAVKRMLGVK